VTSVPGAPRRGEKPVATGGRSSANGCGDLAAPALLRTWKLSLRDARRGTSTSIHPVPRPSTGVRVEPYETRSAGPKPDPEMRTRVPGGPPSGLTRAMSGRCGSTRKRCGLRARWPLARDSSM
jgi:hypothetical protein